MGKSYDIVVKLSAQKQAARVIENWTTRDKYKAKKQVRISSKEVLKKTTLNKVKEKAKN